MFGVLTSAGIQRRYLRGCEKRDVITIASEYWLLNISSKSDVPAGIRAKLALVGISGGNNNVNSQENPENSPGNPQSKVKESKGNNKNNMCKADALALFEKLWKLYPVKKGKGQVSDAKKMQLLKIGYDEMSRAIERYKKYVDSVDYLQYQNGGTFFNGGYVDYLDENYTNTNPVSKRPKNSFSDFPQREYDFTELEKQLLSNNSGR